MEAASQGARMIEAEEEKLTRQQTSRWLNGVEVTGLNSTLVSITS